MADPERVVRAETEVRPRALVPSERQAAEGIARAEVVETPAAGPPRRSIIGRARAHVRDLDPRAISGGRTMVPLFVLGSIALISQWDDNALGILLPEMRGDFAFDLQFLFTLQAVLSVVALLLAPLMGFLADRAPRVWLIRVGALLSNAASIGIGMAQGIPQLVLGRVALGLGGSVSQPAGLPLIADTYPSRTRARAIAFIGVAGGLGAIAGPVIGGNLAFSFGWRTAVVTLGFVSLGASLLAFLLREPTRGAQDRLEMGATPEEAAIEQPPVGWSESWRAAKRITTVRRFWYAAPFLHAAGAPVLVIMQLYYAEIFGLDTRARGTIGAVNAAVIVVALLLSGPVADRMLRDRPGRVMTIIGLGLVAQAAATVAFAFTPWVWLAVAINLPIAFLSGLFAPALFTMLTLTVPARYRGLGIQTVAPWQLIGVLILPPFGALADRIGLQMSLVLFSPLFLVAAVILGTAGFGVARDMDAAKAASLAEREAREARAAGRSKILVCRRVDVDYDGVQVVFGVDFDVTEGEIVALLGTNGAGKSTLLRAIAGVHEASGGAIFFDGRDVTHMPPHRIAEIGIAFVPGGRSVFPSLTVDENLRAAGWSERDAAAVAERRERALAAFPALRERLGEQSGNLSGGEQQMLALAQALIGRPKLLMIDELTLGLSPQIVERLLEILRAIHEQGTTIVLVEQSINVALTVAERAVFLEKGEVRFDGPTRELLGRGDILRSVFLGSAAAGTLAAVPARRRAPAEEPEVVLRAEGLRARFGGVLALDGAGVELRAADIVGIIGPNGAGKTTFFDAISGTVPVEDGRVWVEGADVTGLGPDARARAGLGRSFQTARLFPTMTARETITVALDRHLGGETAILAAAWWSSVRRLERRAARRVDALIELLGLGAYADKFVGELSTATRRVVDLACVMASSPRALLLDEPSSGLSQAETEELGPLLERLVRETGCGLLLIEHDLPLVTSVSSRLVAMELGRVIAEGSPADVVTHPGVVRSYLGTAEETIQNA